jgi:hypothetical protein
MRERRGYEATSSVFRGDAVRRRRGQCQVERNEPHVDDACAAHQRAVRS